MRIGQRLDEDAVHNAEDGCRAPDAKCQRQGGYGGEAPIAAQLAQSVNYQIQYTPGPVDATGAIRSFSLQARAGNYGFRNFYLDDSGILRATGESRAATSEDPPY